MLELVRRAIYLYYICLIDICVKDWGALLYRGLRLDCSRVRGKPEVETVGQRGATMILPGETEAGTAGTQPCRGIVRWAHRDDEQGREDSFLRRQPPSDRKTPCLENPRP